MFALTDLSVWLLASFPNRDVLSRVCNISHQPLTRHWNNNNVKCVAFAAKWVQATAAALQRLGSGAALGWPRPKGFGPACQPLPSCLRHCCSWRYRCGCFADLTPAISETSKPPTRRRSLNRACKRTPPTGRHLSPEEEIREVLFRSESVFA